jgi:hypothetical protein
MDSFVQSARSVRFFHEAMGKIVKTRQEIFKTPPRPQSRFHMTPAIMLVTNNCKGKSKEAAVESEEDFDENEIIHEPESSLVYGIQPDYHYSDSATVME